MLWGGLRELTNLIRQAVQYRRDKRAHCDEALFGDFINLPRELGNARGNFGGGLTAPADFFDHTPVHGERI